MVRALGLLVLLAGCADSLTWLPYPDVTGAKSIVLGVDDASGYHLRGFDLARPEAVVLDGESPHEVEALVFEESLAELGLAAGPIQSATGDTMPIAAPKGRFSLTIEPGQTPAWAEASAVSPALADLRVPNDRPCPEMEWRLHTFGAFVAPSFVLRADRTSAIVGTADQVFARVGFEGATPMTLIGAGQSSVMCAFRTPDGRYYFGGSRGELWRAQIGDTTIQLSLIATSAVASSVVVLGGGVTSAGVELFVLHANGRLERYDGAFEQIADLGARASDDGGIAWIEPGSAYIAWPAQTAVLRYANGRISSEPIPSAVSVTQVAVVPGIGPVAVTSLGEILRRDEGGWHLVGTRRFGLFLYAIEPYLEGFLVGGAIGFIQYWSASRGFCPYDQLTQKPLHHLAALEDGLFVGAGGTPGSMIETAALVARPIPR